MCLRSAHLRPSKSIYPHFDEEGIWVDSEMVNEVIQKRSALMDMAGDPKNKEGVNGRLLLHIIDYSNHNGLTADITKGFLDDNDTPPWDTWVDVVESKNDGIRFLVSWVPQPFEAIIQMAVESEAVGMLFWGDEPTGIFKANFPDVEIPEWLTDISHQLKENS